MMSDEFGYPTANLADLTRGTGAFVTTGGWQSAGQYYYYHGMFLQISEAWQRVVKPSTVVVGVVVAVIVVSVVAGHGLPGNEEDVSPVGVASAATPVSSCTDISSSGVYELQSDITNSNQQYCFNVTADDVVLDGNGHTVDGVGVDFTYAIYVWSSDNVTIRNFEITEWTFGIFHRDSDVGTITANTLQNNTEDGIALVVSSDENTIAENTAVENGGMGVEIEQSSANNVVRGNNLSANFAGGVSIFDGNDNLIVDNTVVANEGTGISAGPAADRTVIRNNDVTDNVLHGIQVIRSAGSVIDQNEVTENAEFAYPKGIDIVDAHDTAITDNTVTRNGGIGVHIESRTGPATQNHVRSNIVSDNEQDGIAVINATNNTVEVNVVRRNALSGIRLDRSRETLVVENNASENTVGIMLNGSRDNALPNNTAMANADWDYRSRIDSVENPVTNLFIGDSVAPTMITFEKSKDIALRSVQNPPPDPPNKQNIGHYVNGTQTNTDSFVFLNISYQDSDVTSAGVTESSLRMWRYRTSWSKVTGTNGVNTVDNYVYANITSFPPAPEVFAPLGNQTEPTPTPTPTATPTPTPTPTESPSGTPTPTATPSGAAGVVYSTKFVCGRIPEAAGGDRAAEEPPAKPGNYATAINIGNFRDDAIRFTVRASVASTLETTRGDPEPGPVSTDREKELEAHQAVEYDCASILQLFEGDAVMEARFAKGFLTIETQTELEVTAVYSSRTSREPAAGMGLDVEHIEPHRVGGEGTATPESEPAREPAETPTATPQSLPGFGAPAAIAALLLVWVVAGMRRQRG